MAGFDRVQRKDSSPCIASQLYRHFPLCNHQEGKKMPKVRTKNAAKRQKKEGEREKEMERESDLDNVSQHHGTSP